MVLPKVKCSKFDCGCECAPCALAKARKLAASAHCKKHDADCHANCF